MRKFKCILAKTCHFTVGTVYNEVPFDDKKFGPMAKGALCLNSNTSSSGIQSGYGDNSQFEEVKEINGEYKSAKDIEHNNRTLVDCFVEDSKKKIKELNDMVDSHGRPKEKTVIDMTYVSKVTQGDDLRLQHLRLIKEFKETNAIFLSKMDGLLKQDNIGDIRDDIYEMVDMAEKMKKMMKTW